MRWYDWYWTCWFLLAFGVLETLGLVTGHREWTLSDFVWRVANVTPGQALWKWTAIHVFLALGGVWLWFHFDFRWWR